MCIRDRYITSGEGAGRFGGWIYDYRRFIEYPLGYGIITEISGKNIFGETISSPCGLGRFIRMWGIFGILFLLWSLFNLSSRLSLIFGNRNKVFLLIVVLIFLFSNPIERDPLFMMILYLPLFVLTEKITLFTTYNRILLNKSYN